MDPRLAQKLAGSIAALKREIPTLRVGEITDDSPLSVELGGGEPYSEGVKTITPVAVGDIVVALQAGQRPPLILGSLGSSRSVAGDETNLKVVRGIVSSTGTLVEGSGFTSSRTGVGAYRITFTTPFSDIPAVVATTLSSATPDATLGSVSTSQANIVTFEAGVASEDIGFHFIAVGPR